MKKALLPIVFIFIFCLWSLRSIFHPGFMYSHDSLWHVQRLQNMVSLLPAQFPVRWSPTLDNGYGIPLFNFAYPAPYYLGAVFMFLGLGPVKAYYVLLFLSYFAGGVGVYFLAKKRVIGLIAALLYLLTPYQFLDIFVRGALGEVVALGLIPWVILCYQQISRTGRIAWYSPLPFAVLLISHNFYAYLFAGMLAVITIFFYQNKLKILITFLLSLALSAFFILPALQEKSFLLISQAQNQQFSDHFVYPQQLLYSTWSYFGSVIGENPSEMSFQLGVANIVVLVSAMIYAILQLLKRAISRPLFAYISLTLFVIFMTTSYSSWFWQHLPLISSLQFPWRFLGLAAILNTLLYLELSKEIAPMQYPKFILFSLLLVAVALFNTRNYYRPVKWLNESEFLSLHYEYVGKNTTAHRDELVPRWAAVERHLPPVTLIVSNGAEVTSTQESDLGLTFVATAPGVTSSAIYHRNYYPMWHLTIDGKNAPLEPTSTGEITFPLQPGERKYELYLASTPTQQLGNVISLFSPFLIFAVVYQSSKPIGPKLTKLRHTSKRA